MNIIVEAFLPEAEESLDESGNDVKQQNKLKHKLTNFLETNFL